MARTERDLVAWLALCMAVTAAYLATLGWDNERDVAPDGHLTGPWEAWQIAVLVLLLAGATVTAQLCGVRSGALVVVPLTVTGWWIWSVLRIESSGASFWPIGAVMVFAGTAGGVVLSEKAIDKLRAAPPGRRFVAVLSVVSWLCLGGALVFASVGFGPALALALASVACFTARSLVFLRLRRTG